MMGIELCDLKNKIINADPAKIKAKDSYFQLKTIAKNTGHAALFNTKKQYSQEGTGSQTYTKRNTIVSCILECSMFADEGAIPLLIPRLLGEHSHSQNPRQQQQMTIHQTTTQ